MRRYLAIPPIPRRPRAAVANSSLMSQQPIIAVSGSPLSRHGVDGSFTPVQDRPSAAVNIMWLNPLDGENPTPSGNGRATHATGGSLNEPASEQRRDSSATDVEHPEMSSAHGTDESQPSPARLTADRLRKVLERVTSGFYDSPEVIHRVAEQVEDELARGDDGNK